ncbi:MAG: hypothetical protein WAX38_01100 [Minisyncoccia bacterium]
MRFVVFTCIFLLLPTMSFGAGVENSYLPPTKLEFTGKIKKITHCANNVKLVRIGAPSNNYYIWSPKVTKTYNHNPKKWKVGDKITGTAGDRYFCIGSVLPLVVFPGYLMSSLGLQDKEPTTTAPFSTP